MASFGPYMHYYSDYPNQVHQLNVSLSKNYFLLKDGTVKYQEKKFDINLKNYHKTGKRHLINFVIRDHFSSCYYAEIHPIDVFPLEPLLSYFLFNAWKEKEHYPFRGIPKELHITRTALEICPVIENLEKNYDINIELASSGFANGVISVKNWEKELRYHVLNYQTHSDFKITKDRTLNFDFLCFKIHAEYDWSERRNLSKWTNSQPLIRLVNDIKEYKKLLTH